jgi:SAM-dependent methyltransferase
LKLLGSVKGKRILEIGCGGGQNSIAFAKQGALATGLDISEEQLEFAKKLAQRDRVKVEFLKGDMANMNGVGSDSFDVVFSACAICYAPIEKTFKEVHRVLRKDGLFVFSEIHPFFNIFSYEDFSLERSYFETGYSEGDWYYEQNGKKQKIRCGDHTYRVGDFSNTLIDSGFKIERILEPAPVEKDEVSDFALDYPPERLKMVPGTIIFVSRRSE